MRTQAIGLLAAVLIATSCATSSATPSPSSTAFPSVSATPGGSSTPTPTAGPPTGHWEAAGTMETGRGNPDAVLLGDGRVLVVGNDDEDCVRSDSMLSEIWDPASGGWSAGPSLNKPRAEFVAVTMADGRALITGGLNPGDAADEYNDAHASYSSTYILDPAAPGTWIRAGLLHNARTVPAAAALADGRVLVMGGWYLAGPPTAGALGALEPIASRPGPRGGSTSDEPVPADVEPPASIPALATAELYDPETDTWSRTGAMRFARIGASAVTLADGRVLVQGSRTGFWWNYAFPSVDGRVYDTAEIYDPGAGRFALAGDLPPVDLTPLASLDIIGVQTYEPDRPGTLVALADGSALLVGRSTPWYTEDPYNEGSAVETLRFDGTTGQWTIIDVSLDACIEGDCEAGRVDVIHGHTRQDALVVPLAGGRVLVAGGRDPATDRISSAADLYDPVTDTWFPLPSMHEPRAGGSGVALPDGSALLVGGHGDPPTCRESYDCDCGLGPTGLATAIRFVPGP
jgi:hypothetical protein